MNDTQTQPTMADRIAEHGITMTAERITARPDRAATDWDKGAAHFLVTLRCGREVLTVPYSMGSAHLDRYVMEKARGKFGFSAEDLRRAFNGGRSIHDESVRSRAREQYGKGFAPDLPSVLDSLVFDASCYEGARNFEDFAAEMGYDSDSRKAEAMYNACGQTAKDLRRLVGRAAFDELMNNTERM